MIEQTFDSKKVSTFNKAWFVIPTLIQEVHIIKHSKKLHGVQQ